MALKDKTLKELLDYGRGVAYPTTLETELLNRLEKILEQPKIEVIPQGWDPYLTGEG
jgi:hypothetical protein